MAELDLQLFAGLVLIVGRWRRTFKGWGLQSTLQNGVLLDWIPPDSNYLPGPIKTRIQSEGDGGPLMLTTAQVAADGLSCMVSALVVFDDHKHLRYGGKFLASSTPVFVVRDVHFE